MQISLSKGQRISLKKENGQLLDKIGLGVNWGMITKKGFFGGTSKEAVDLDASAILVDENGTIVDTIYFGNKTAAGIRHSGDDRSGDDEDDGKDNEVIEVKLSEVDSRVVNIGFVLNSYTHQKFDEIPYAGCRIFEGNANNPGEIFAKLDVSKDDSFMGRECMILGSFYKKDGEWKFRSIAETTNDKTIGELARTYAQKYGR